MKRSYLTILFSTLFLWVFSLISPPIIFAQSIPSCSSQKIIFSETTYILDENHTIYPTITAGLLKDHDYQITLTKFTNPPIACQSNEVRANVAGTTVFQISKCTSTGDLLPENYKLTVRDLTINQNQCEIDIVVKSEKVKAFCIIDVQTEDVLDPSCLTPSEEFYIRGSNFTATINGNPTPVTQGKISYGGKETQDLTLNDYGMIKFNTQVTNPIDNYIIQIFAKVENQYFPCGETKKYNIRANCNPTEIDTSISDYNLCERLGSDNKQCSDCEGNNGVWTALGCLHYDPQAFISEFLTIAIGLAGGVALLLMIYGSFLISTSAGDPKKAEEGKEIITGTIAGLLFIIFSVLLLRIIGVKILNIPGF